MYIAYMYTHVICTYIIYILYILYIYIYIHPEVVEYDLYFKDIAILVKLQDFYTVSVPGISIGTSCSNLRFGDHKHDHVSLDKAKSMGR